MISFRVAIDAHDVGFLLDHLHPIVIQTYGAQACRAFIERDVLALENYEQTGPALGPIIRVFESPGGGVTIQTYEVPIAFEFEGSHYADKALFGLDGGTFRWFAECR